MIRFSLVFSKVQKPKQICFYQFYFRLIAVSSIHVQLFLYTNLYYNFIFIFDTFVDTGKIDVISRTDVATASDDVASSGLVFVDPDGSSQSVPSNAIVVVSCSY